MSDAAVAGIAQEALMTALMIAGPILAMSLAVGLIVSLFQAMTQVNEVTLTFVPKILGVFAVSAIFGPWMISTMVGYTQRILATLPLVVR